ncbi:MAG: hypothetical protein WC119_00760 [Synergistaceae bacterium]
MSTKSFNGEICFFCRKPIEGEGIEWQEQNNWLENPDGDNLITVNLHAECSVDLGIRLIRDGMKLMSKQDVDLINDKKEVVKYCLNLERI